MSQISKAAIILVVALRLATGWHFYSEGVKKLEPGFSSAGVLRAATGPLAPFYHGMVTGPHEAFPILSAPLKEGTRTPEQAAELGKWLEEYAKAAAAAIKSGEPLPTDVSPHASYAPLLGNVRESWNQGLKRLRRQNVMDEQMAQAEKIQERELGDLLYYLFGEGPAIDELQHEAWRLEQMHKEVIGEEPAPFLQDRIKKKTAEIWKTMQPWAAAVTQSEESFIDAVTRLVTELETADAEDAPTPSKVKSALAERSFLKRIDMIVTYVVIGCGVGLFLGLFTPLAAVVAALFLISIIATQPPWVADANTTYFFYQLVEVVALLLLAAVSAGRWAGLDRLIFGPPPKVEDTPWA